MYRNAAIALFATVLALSCGPVGARTGTMTCKMTYSMSGWSILYKHASGTGTVTCSNGKKMAVKLTANGGGLTAGKYKITNGTGEFSGVRDIKDVLGTYASAGADAAAGKAAAAQAMTKGDISLALAGKGEGWNLGVQFEGFTISKP
ncbi:hypothetical protein GCM10027431_28820 [Lysobacter rhizosphaerae]